MTAFVVHVEHIHVLLWAGLRDPRLGALRWNTATVAGELQPETASTVGQMLLDENIASVAHLHNEPPAPEIYKYRPPAQRGWTNVELLNALHCYRYQSCEHPDWEGSEAQAFTEALEARLIHRLPGYSSGPWAITPSSVPSAARTRGA
ncbi:hypothetical protein BTO20_37560 (plasmid) [Mycobacterium dioxanotrophicus]|jgi:hypothetical protein|uniref:Uncharacterized protein n=1 Tax=Mycobacterium dioxanotrophicus TaxID=482462 RepID=A0A1Y0CGC0_9MYCO|nr:hypothetical protein [Mycobacterium dioxanotrophicus]ART74333.1 hypothetical protein BTO20_37560 [Mycobacterium dioxanotrophicus]